MACVQLIGTVNASAVPICSAAKSIIDIRRGSRRLVIVIIIIILAFDGVMYYYLPLYYDRHICRGFVWRSVLLEYLSESRWSCFRLSVRIRVQKTNNDAAASGEWRVACGIQLDIAGCVMSCDMSIGPCLPCK